MKDVRQFVGLASYYHRFSANLAKIIQSLHALTSKVAVFKWTDQSQNAFTELKNHHTSALILPHPDFSKPFSLETDVSFQRIGTNLITTTARQQTSPHNIC